MKAYFKVKSQEWMSLSVPEYVSTALRWLTNELDCGIRYYPHSYERMIILIEREIITEVAEKLANNESSGVVDMLFKKNREDLKNIFQLFKRVDDPNDTTGHRSAGCLNFICSKYQVYIQEQGQIFIKQQQSKKSNPIDFVKNIISFKALIDDLTNNVFEGL